MHVERFQFNLNALHTANFPVDLPRNDTSVNSTPTCSYPLSINSHDFLVSTQTNSTKVCREGEPCSKGHAPHPTVHALTQQSGRLAHVHYRMRDYEGVHEAETYIMGRQCGTGSWSNHARRTCPSSDHQVDVAFSCAARLCYVSVLAAGT